MTPPTIDAYQFGEIVIDQKAYRKDVIITPDGVEPNWWREKGHSLSLVDLVGVMQNPPQVLVVGQGAYGRMAVPGAIQREIEARGVQVIAQRTKNACQTYNQLRAQKRVVAALHLTC